MTLAAGALAACAGAGDRDPPAGQPSVYQSLAHADAEVDVNAAQSMISGYRRNNGLTPLSVDPTLTRLAYEQASWRPATSSITAPAAPSPSA
jgi:hypothetical protein